MRHGELTFGTRLVGENVALRLGDGGTIDWERSTYETRVLVQHGFPYELKRTDRVRDALIMRWIPKAAPCRTSPA